MPEAHAITDKTVVILENSPITLYHCRKCIGLLFATTLLFVMSYHLMIPNRLSFFRISPRIEYYSPSNFMNFNERKYRADIYNAFQGETFLFANKDHRFALEGLSIDHDSSLKIILLYFDGRNDHQSTGSRIFSPCPEKRCALTTNRAYFNRSAAVLFLPQEYSPSACISVAPKGAFSSQIFVYVMGESPINGVGCGYLLNENFFNWTMTYRLDSDIRGHYTFYTNVVKEKKNFAQGKTKLIAWLVSNCHTHGQREKYVDELRKFIPVDVYGRCGNLSCDKNCDGVLKDYKFYLAFENSMCKDYVTEKTVRALENGLVPIVYGDGNYKIFPPHSYIHAYDFSSPAALAEHLRYLDKNDSVYNDLMAWRHNPKFALSRGAYSAKANGFCRLCEKLHEPHLNRSSKSYFSIFQWWIHGVSAKVNSTERRFRTKRLCRSPDWLFARWKNGVSETRKG